jgi:quinol-cytochrome oxidoreductase complex cytochrome b subunit
MNRRLEERRAQHQQYKKDVKERGRPFYPYAMFHDTVMSLFVVTLIVVISVIWKFTSTEGSDPEAAGHESEPEPPPARAGLVQPKPRVGVRGRPEE